MSKMFIVVLLLIVVGILSVFIGIKRNSDINQDYVEALELCGLTMGESFSVEELLTAQRCACEKSDLMSCNFLKVQNGS